MNACTSSKELLIFTFLGLPGSGKGTLAAACDEKPGFIRLSTGDLFRTQMALQTDFGKKIAEFMQSGQLVPDSLVTQTVINWLEKHKRLHSRIILDGFPRTAAQAKEFIDLFLHKYEKVSFRVIVLRISRDELAIRMMTRLVCQNPECQAVYSLRVKLPKKEGLCDLCGFPLIHRNDDKKEVIEERFFVYERHLEDLLAEYARNKYKIINIDVEDKAPEDVFELFRGVCGDFFVNTYPTTLKEANNG